jgi:hypothetical protein
VPWLPLTYNLETQLAAFIADFHGRQDNNEDNVWIVKPWYGPCRQLASQPFPWASHQPTARNVSSQEPGEGYGPPGHE